MKVKLSIIYSWFIRSITYFLPNIPLIMRFRGFLYSLFMDECGKDFQVASSVYFNTLCGIKIGNNVYIAHNTVIIGLDLIIENEVIIGPNCVISGGNHVLNNGSFRFGVSEIARITIEKGAWVSANCTLIGGAILPQRSILAAGGVLTKPYKEDNSIYGGIPASLIKKINV